MGCGLVRRKSWSHGLRAGVAGVCVLLFGVLSCGAQAQAEAPFSSAQARHVFEVTWQIVADYHVDAALAAEHWRAMRDVFEPRVRAARTAGEFYALMQAMVASLNDGHSVFLPPRAAQLVRAHRSGAPGARIFGLAANLRAMPDGSLLVLQVPARAEAARWLKPGERILAIEGVPASALGATAALFDARAQVHLTLVDAQGRTRTATVPKELFDASQFPPPVLAQRLEGEIGYLALYDFAAFGGSAYARDALTRLTRRKPISGLIIDVRANEGGVMGQMLDVLGMFLEGGDAGAHVDREGNASLYQVPTGRLLPALRGVPIVVLVGATTQSAAEIFAAVLQAHGRARVVGTPTPGNTELVRPFRLPDGSSVWLAVAAYRAPSGQMLEGTGVVPDVIVEAPWWRFALEDDPQLAAAVRVVRALRAAPAPSPLAEDQRVHRSTLGQ